MPFANRVLVKRAEAATKSKGGILLSELNKQDVNYGVVIETGPGLTHPQGFFRENLVKVG